MDTDSNALEQVLAEKIKDMSTPSFPVEFSPDEAQCFGAFVEDALSEQDALDASIDLLLPPIKK